MKAFFFDMDGTLIDSRADLATAVNHTRRDLGLAPLPLEKIIACVGNGARYLLSHAIPEVADRADELMALHMKNYMTHVLDATTLYPGVEATLRELAHRGCALGVVTNKPHIATVALLEHFKLAELFGAGVVAGEDCLEMKPSPKPLQQAAAALNHVLTPDDWMVGDNWTDLATAAACKVNAAFCDFGFGNARNEFISRHLSNFSELLNVL